MRSGGTKISDNILGDVDEGPVGIHSIQGCDDCKTANITNSGSFIRKQQVVPETDAAEIHDMLAEVVAKGTGTSAAIPGVEVVGKTGTTSNYVDAWFCGWTSQLTTCVWVGYPDSGKSMSTDWNGQPVMGGTYPALIWHNYTEQALNILTEQAAAASGSTDTSTTPLLSTTPESAGTVAASDNGAATNPTDEGTAADNTTAPTTAGATGNSGTAATGAAGAGGGTAGTGATAAGTGAGANTTPATVAPVEPTPATTPAASPAAPASGNTGSGIGGTTGGAGLGGG